VICRGRLHYCASNRPSVHKDVKTVLVVTLIGRRQAHFARARRPRRRSVTVKMFATPSSDPIRVIAARNHTSSSCGTNFASNQTSRLTDLENDTQQRRSVMRKVITLYCK
jgi:hypothetical protein